MKTLVASDKAERVFIEADSIRELCGRREPTDGELEEILSKALAMKGLDAGQTASLIQVKSRARLQRVLRAAEKVKQTIYGRRMVFFAPLYIGNICSNNCLYCGFRRDNRSLVRAMLSMEEIARETRILLRQGHKRILMLSGESARTPIDYFLEAIRTVYGTREGGASIRRVNAEIAPLAVDDFARLREAGIGTYVCFQETYDPALYAVYHPSGPKRNYEYRLTVMDRAMRAGIHDVGLGALFGLGDWRFEVLGLLHHARHLEEVFGCGPHTVSVPRLKPAEGSAISQNAPAPVSDEDFMLLVAAIRLAMPYTGIILSTRESEALRNRLFRYGVSQISAGSRTNPGAYTAGQEEKTSGAQFALGDHRSLEEVVSHLIDAGLIPSFCTGCYRMGRVGQDFMELAKPGLIKRFCLPNGLFTFKEYLLDYAGPEVRRKGEKLLGELAASIGGRELRRRTAEALARIESGERDVYF